MTSQKTALITGASRGFGKEVALALALKGYHIIALSRSASDLETLDDAIKAAGSTATLIPYDLKEPGDFSYLAKMLGGRFAHLDALVLNAATSHDLKPLHNLSVAEIDETMNVNFKNQIALLGKLDPLLRRAQSPTVVGITDAYAQSTHPYFGAYVLSKKALESALYLYAKENEKNHLSVQVFTPKPMATKLRAQFFPGENAENVPEAKTQIPAFLTLFK